ncbi:hypothetical protein D9615_003790 [Tricholomella constricta]|uniref:VWFA domain-containing protein n=1 Tax=Tricholomella constricta TaxID=117010 RepID=A0A8H5M7U2_9AGAR|nr:hypothetical protein D9615_003790 [Tricholomella constricta]
MASRPSFTAPERGRITFTIPPEWFVNISAVSRQNYNQNVLLDGDNARIHYSNNNLVGGLMSETNTGFISSSIVPDFHTSTLDVYFSFTTGARRLNASQLRRAEFRSHRAVVTAASRNTFAPDEVPEYVNYFVFVEDQARSGIHDMLLVVSLHSTNRNEIPPPPPDNVVRPYNPILDLPWPGVLENYLRQYHVHFLIDDSGSMSRENRWQEASNALIGLSHAIFDRQFVRNGIELSFLNAAPAMHGITDREQVANLFRQVGQPSGGTPTGRHVSRILNAHIDVLDAAIGTEDYVTIKPLNLIVITDGAPNDPPATELTQMLINVGARLASVPHHPNSLGVQFVQIGSDPDAATALPKLIQADTGHIVDTVPWLGPGSLSPDRLERILLGGLHPNIRGRRALGIRSVAATAEAISPLDVEASSPEPVAPLDREIPASEIEGTPLGVGDSASAAAAELPVEREIPIFPPDVEASSLEPVAPLNGETPAFEIEGTPLGVGDSTAAEPPVEGEIPALRLGAD